MKKSTIILLVLIILSVGIYFGVNYFLNKDLKEQQQQLDDMIAEYGTIEKENVNTAVAKFNTEIMDGGLENPAKEDANSTSEDQLYWYMIEDGIYCYVKPEEYTGDVENDIVHTISVYYEIASGKQEKALEYFKLLIKSNKNDFTDEQITELINKAEELKEEKQKAVNGSGVMVGIAETEDHIEYQVTRNYE